LVSYADSPSLILLVSYVDSWFPKETKRINDFLRKSENQKIRKPLIQRRESENQAQNASESVGGSKDYFGFGFLR
jgi:methionine salvage enolase-phosphatase E1